MPPPTNPTEPRAGDRWVKTVTTTARVTMDSYRSVIAIKNGNVIYNYSRFRNESLMHGRKESVNTSSFTHWTKTAAYLGNVNDERKANGIG